MPYNLPQDNRLDNYISGKESGIKWEYNQSQHLFRATSKKYTIETSFFDGVTEVNGVTIELENLPYEINDVLTKAIMIANEYIYEQIDLLDMGVVV